MHRSAALLLIVLTWLGCKPAAVEEEHLVLDFEKAQPGTAMPHGWARGVGRGESGLQPAAVVGMDSALKHSGRYALALASASEGDFLSVVHTIPKTYDGDNLLHLSGYLKTEAVKEWAGLWIRVSDIEGQTLAFENMNTQPVKGTTGWKRYDVYVDYDKTKAVSIHVGALLIGSGKLWVDGLHIELDKKDLATVPEYKKVLLPAERDTVFNGGSSIATISTTPQNRVETLAKLGQVWGFLKYHHPAVREGRYNMDAALFRVLPRVLAASNSASADAVLETWVDSFGKLPRCADCKTVDARLAELQTVVLRPDYGDLFRTGALPTSLQSKLAAIRDARDPTDSPHYYIEVPGFNPRFRNEYSYHRLLYPDAGVRLLAVYRYWAMIQYFCPNRHLIGESWPDVLRESILESCAAGNAGAYQLAMLKFIARLHDGHAGLSGRASALDSLKGPLTLPFTATFAGNDLVVTGFLTDTAGVRTKLRVGDVVVSIDGIPVRDLVQRLLPVTPASNHATALRDLSFPTSFLMRSANPMAALRVSDEKGGKRAVQVARIAVAPLGRAWYDALWSGQPTKGYKVLSGNIGYLFAGRLTEASIDSVKRALHRTTALIIDLRCYPTAEMPVTYGKWLKGTPSQYVSSTVGSDEVPGMFKRTNFLNSTNGLRSNDTYRGKVVILVNEMTQSAAEWNAMAFQSIPGALTVGSTTAGADGNVSEIVLPGGLSTMISGIGVQYPDGTETQRAGVRIDKVVKPTAAGIRAGRDEVLEAALVLLRR